jgi:hypothetical protein
MINAWYILQKEWSNTLRVPSKKINVRKYTLRPLVHALEFTDAYTRGWSVYPISETMKMRARGVRVTLEFTDACTCIYGRYTRIYGCISWTVYGVHLKICVQVVHALEFTEAYTRIYGCLHAHFWTHAGTPCV